MKEQLKCRSQPALDQTGSNTKLKFRKYPLD